VINKSTAELRRLPLWGVTNINDTDINFSWPSQAEAASTPTLETIRFWFKDANTVCMRGVQFCHANQVSSQRFSTGDVMQVCIEVDAATLRQTRRV